MSEIKFRTPTRCQNGHFRWLYSIAGFFNVKQEWEPQRCGCHTGGFKQGFEKCGDAELAIGLKDVRGNDVYEGDMVRFLTFEGQGVVVYMAPTFQARERDTAKCHALQGYEFEIAGNLYESK